MSRYHFFSARYTKWGEAYAAKEEKKKKSKTKGREMPDPNKVDLYISEECVCIKFT